MHTIIERALFGAQAEGGRGRKRKKGGRIRALGVELISNYVGFMYCVLGFEYEKLCL